MKKTMRICAALLVIFTFMLSLTGCSAVKQGEAAVRNMLEAFKAADLEKAREYIDLDAIGQANLPIDLAESADTYMKAILKEFDYQMLSSEQVEDGVVNVTVKITSLDMKPIFNDFLTEAMKYLMENAMSDPRPTEEETNAKLSELFVSSVSKPDFSTVTNEVVIKTVKTDGKWRVDADETVVNAILGGLLSAAEELISEAQ